MNRKHALALALAAFGSAAFAQSGELDLQHFGATQPSTTTRAAVRAEVIKARANGENLLPAEADIAGVFQKAPAASTVTRAQRRAEVLQARSEGAFDRPAEVDVNATPIVSTRSRDEVRKEAIAATRNGQAARGVGAGH
ncbi:DUF4148 domain-containing protein [Rhizobacter sp. J219]|jgi:hypothetical protein|uniref:DUF4148 domain-containing protein n=1 Tax=Rhizobacter sp. J219 TaxID=2898430 RepID=UPI002150BD2D|nr:DUF4148 domain-containing protein [Rhizobacter sp. J219]MCR5884249.1 DUF4148 domain-containing protein [Rhizobacter sp. J219]